MLKLEIKLDEDKIRKQGHCIRLWFRRLRNSKLIIQQQQMVHCLLSDEGAQEIMVALEK